MIWQDQLKCLTIKGNTMVATHQLTHPCVAFFADADNV